MWFQFSFPFLCCSVCWNEQKIKRSGNNKTDTLFLLCVCENLILFVLGSYTSHDLMEKRLNYEKRHWLLCFNHCAGGNFIPGREGRRRMTISFWKNYVKQHARQLCSDQLEKAVQRYTYPTLSMMFTRPQRQLCSTCSIFPEFSSPHPQFCIKQQQK